MKIINNKKYEEYLELKNKYKRAVKKIEESYEMERIRLMDSFNMSLASRDSRMNDNLCYIQESQDGKIKELEEFIKLQRSQIYDLTIKLDMIMTIKKKNLKHFKTI